ncbi:MAG: carboxypeptidase-like regulatory domain-containing protein [Acidobacteriia bacterium]|nr:carboxypeptidase-like regulatory domain-containing protein [Terriglobia bacterium]
MALLVSPLPLRAQAPARDNPRPATGTASIRGRVVDATGKPLSRVEIRASAAGVNQQANGLTDGDGRYDLNNLPAGIYTVVATKANYVRTSWGEQRPEGPGKRITLADGQKLDNINLSLGRAGVITGKIVDEFGDPVTDVFVSAMRYAYVQGSRRLMPGGRGGATNDIGEFRVYGLSPGQYYVSATLRNFSVGANTDSTDRTGYAPTFYPGTGNVAEAQRLTIAPGQTVANINLALLPIQTAKVSGIAVDSEGKPMANAMIMVGQKVGGTMTNNMGFPVGIDGKFTVSGLTPGDYTLRVGAPAVESATADITITGSDITDLQLIVAKPSTIRGRIVFTDSATSAAPPKPTALDLGAWRDWAIGQQVRSQAKIQDDGTFEISLAAGRVQVRAAPNGGSASTPPWRLNRVVLGDLDVGDTGIEVPPNATVDNVIVEMTNHNSDVSGRVTDADGNVVRDVFVIVFAQDPVHWTVQTRYLSVARPGVDDLFHARLLAGDYYVVAMGDVEAGAWTDPDFLTAAREHAVKFSIADGEKKTIDLPVSPAPVF